MRFTADVIREIVLIGLLVAIIAVAWPVIQVILWGLYQ